MSNLRKKLDDALDYLKKLDKSELQAGVYRVNSDSFYVVRK